jgi:hypothetical protein
LGILNTLNHSATCLYHILGVLYKISPTLQLLSRRNALHERAQSRRAALEDSFHLQQFSRDSDELKSWINEKMKTATDEAYKVSMFLSFSATLASYSIVMYFSELVIYFSGIL